MSHDLSAAPAMSLPDDRDGRARRRARGCVPPLVLVAIVFVLPTIRACDRVESPLSYGVDMGALTAASAWTPFLIAAALAVLTLLRPAATPLSPNDRGVLLAPIVIWLTSAWSVFVMMDEAIAKTHTRGAVAVPALALAIALPLSIVSFRRALRASGWTRWLQALRSFAAAAWLTLPVQWISMCLVDRESGLELGAYVLLVGMAWLSVAAARRV
jgi:hypothetical protein